MYRKRAIITRTLFEAALVYKPGILRSFNRTGRLIESLEYVHTTKKVRKMLFLFGWRPHKGQMNKKESRNIRHSKLLAAVKNGVKKYRSRLIMVRVW